MALITQRSIFALQQLDGWLDPETGYAVEHSRQASEIGVVKIITRLGAAGLLGLMAGCAGFGSLDYGGPGYGGGDYGGGGYYDRPGLFGPSFGNFGGYGGERFGEGFGGFGGFGGGGFGDDDD